MIPGIIFFIYNHLKSAANHVFSKNINGDHMRTFSSETTVMHISRNSTVQCTMHRNLGINNRRINPYNGYFDNVDGEKLYPKLWAKKIYIF
jgi:hypothetical protein